MPTRTVPRWARALIVAVVLAGAVAVLGAVALWPRGDAEADDATTLRYVDATVTAADDDAFTAELASGPERGDRVDVVVGPAVPRLAEGDDVVLVDVATNPPRARYAFASLAVEQRGTALLWLAAAFVLAFVAVARWQGLRALVGLAAGAAVLVAFLVPALLRDQPVVPVVLAAVAAMAFAALYLAHGVNLGTTVALAGTLAGLALTCGLAVVAIEATDLASGSLDLRGLLVAGIVVGALGVLDDVTVSQVSIVAALRRANPGLPRGVLYREAIRVGRDHLASTVNTLVFAYAGVALPVLVLFARADQPAGRLITGDLVSVEVVRMLVGAIGLVVAVPATTALAAVVLGPDTRDAARRDGDRTDDPVEHPPAHLAGFTRGG